MNYINTLIKYQSILITLTPPTLQAYPFSATEKNVVRGRSLDDRGEEPQTLCNAAFLLSGAALYGRAGQGAARLAGAIPVFEPVQFRPPRFEAGSAVRLTNWRSHIMTELTILTTKIRQLDGLYSLNDLHKAAGGEAKHRPNYFLSNEQTKALINEIQIAGIPAISSKPKYGTYACRELVIAYAAWISAAFHLKVIRVFLEQAKPTLPNASTQAEELKALKEQLLKSLPNLAINPPVWTRPGRSGTSAPQNIEVARKLINELKVWANSLPHEIGHPLWDALDDLNNLLLHGWTEVDEALLHFSVGTGYLKRWMGREKQGGKK